MRLSYKGTIKNTMEQPQKELLKDNQQILKLRKSLRIMYKDIVGQFRESIIKIDSFLEMISQINENLVYDGKEG